MQGSGPEDRYSLGLLSYGPYSETPFDAEVEATVQFGQFDDGDLLAWSLTLQGGKAGWSHWRAIINVMTP